MRSIPGRVITAVLLSVLAAIPAMSQSPTRFSIGVTPVLAQPAGEFRANVGRGWGAGGSLQYRLDPSGFVSWRFDVSWSEYGHESKKVPLSETLAGRILVDETTTNSITAVSTGPELALPFGPVRPYAHAGFGGLAFRTVSTVKGTDSSDGNIASTTNYHDGTSTFVFGAGVRIPLEHRRSVVGLDVGLRYYKGGEASYLREGSIRENPGGSISFDPLRSRTPHMVYMVGMRFRIPFNSQGRCPRLVC